MSAQLTYKFGNNMGAAGGIYDLAPYQIDTFINEENNGVMGFGLAVVDGTTAGTNIKIADSASAKFEGITVNRRTTEWGLDTPDYIRKDVAIGVMRYGKIFGKLATGEEPTFGAPVYVVVSGDEKGCFTTSNSGTMPINARFASTADNGVALIELQQLNIIPAQA